MHFAEYTSPVGNLLLRSDGTALTGVWIGRKAEGLTGEDAVLRAAKQWLDDYFRGEVPEVEIPLAPEGTAFQKRVWQMLLEIPYGKTVTYGEMAARFPGKMSAQAIGQAVGHNPISILIPCHRCVGAGGKLTGYAWGVGRKQWLLDHEQKIGRKE